MEDNEVERIDRKILGWCFLHFEYNTTMKEVPIRRKVLEIAS